MTDRSSIWMLLAVLGIGGALYAGSPSGAPAQRERAESAAAPRGAAAPPATTEAMLAEMLDAFFGLGSAEPAAAWDALRARFSASGGAVLVATMPDPIASHVGYIADQYQEAIRQAATYEGYELERWRLPWRTERCARSGSEDEKTGKRANGCDEAPKGSAHAPRIGALLFRKPPESNHPDAHWRPLLILVVSETSTSGVDAVGLHDALRAARGLRPDAKDLWILGPTFSGSQHSVRAGLEAWCAPQAPDRAGDVAIHLRSGSATSRRLLDLEGPIGAGCGRVDFHSMSWPTEQMLAAMHGFIAARGARRRDTVLLIEGDTGFGSAAARYQEWAVYRYPLHVSQTREAYARQGRLTRDRAALLRSAAQPGLPLPTESRAKPTDVPTTFDPEHSASAADRQLGSLLDAISRDNVRFVGILGTDTYDKLFLARLIREHAPDAQLFTFFADLLYVHSAFSRDLLGMWVASTYPLAPRREGPPMAASSATESAAVALLAILDEMQRGTVTPAPSGVAPSLWISAVGRNGFWLLDECKPQGVDGGAPSWCTQDMLYKAAGFLHRVPESARLDYEPMPARPGSYPILVLLVGAACLAVVATYRRGARGAGRGLLRGTPSLAWLLGCASGAGEESAGPTRADGLAMRALLFATLLVAFLHVALPSVLSLADTRSELRLGESWFAFLGAAVVAFAAWGLAIALLTSWSAQAPGQGKRAIAAVVVGAAAAVSLRDTSDLRIFYERQAALGSGLSPALPVLLIAGGVAAGLVSRARRLRMAEHLGAMCAFASGTTLRRKVDAVAEAIDTPSAVPERWVLATGLAVAVLLGTVAYPAWIGTAEPRLFGAPIFDVAMAGGLLFIAIFGVLAESRFFLAWQRLRAVLHAIAATPMLRAFDRLPRQLARSYGFRLSSTPVRVESLRYALEQARLLVDLEKRQGNANPLPLLPPAVVRVGTPDSPTEKEWEKLARSGGVPGYATSIESDLGDCAAALAPWIAAAWEQLGQIGYQKLGPEVEKLRDGSESPTDVFQRFRTADYGDAGLEVRLAEDFVAAEATRFIGYVFAHLKSLVGFATLGAVLLLLALASYPFQPQQLLMRCVLVGMVAMVALFLVVLVQADRNEILSRIADRTPNRVDFDASFFSPALTYAGIPILTLLVTQFPAFEQQLSRLLRFAGT
jgi:hypothetical protein